MQQTVTAVKLELQSLADNLDIAIYYEESGTHPRS